jgi:hypothetical protein
MTLNSKFQTANSKTLIPAFGVCGLEVGIHGAEGEVSHV